MAFFYIIAIFFISLDRFLKSFFYLNQESIYKINEYASFFYAENRYIAFSIPINPLFIKYFSLLLTIFLILIFVNFIIKKRHTPSLPLFFLILGSFSNIYDRFKYGFVIDYAYIKHFTVFNIADSMIFIGVLLLSYFINTIDKKDKIRYNTNGK